MDRIPYFFQTLCKQKQITNLSEEDLNVLFPLERYPTIKLNEYYCVCVGRKGRKKDLVLIKILQCHKYSLIGKHYIYFCSTGQGLYVESLNKFKHNILNHEDKLSFDRSAFLILPDRQIAIRLHLIRDRLQLPLIEGGYSTPYIEKNNELIYIKSHYSSKESIIDYFYHQLFDFFLQFKKVNSFSENETKQHFIEILECIFKNILESILEESLDKTYNSIPPTDDELFDIIKDVPVDILINNG